MEKANTLVICDLNYPVDFPDHTDTKEKSDLLLRLGINVNLAPVCDVSTNSNDFIYKRSFGKDEKATSHYVKTVVSEMSKNKLGSVPKHFPGYGNNPDTHT